MVALEGCKENYLLACWEWTLVHSQHAHRTATYRVWRHQMLY